MRRSMLVSCQDFLLYPLLVEGGLSGMFVGVMCCFVFVGLYFAVGVVSISECYL